MMRYFIYFLGMFLMFNALSCRKKIATDTTLERTSELGEKFRSLLASSPQGWLVCIENRDGLHYNFYMKFTEGGRVEMKADLNEQSLSLKESSYAIKLLQQPTLSFNTYNYISTLSDPDLGSPRGRGLRTDFEYAVTAELVELLQGMEDLNSIKHFTLAGILYQSKITFKRANNASEGNIINQIIATEKLIASLKSTNLNTLTVLRLNNGSTMNYHYDFRNAGKIFALTSLETTKKGAPMHYYFDICGEGGLTMLFARSKNTTKNQFVNRALMAQFEKMSFSNFSGGSDTMTITFDYSDGKITKKGTLTTINILSAAISEPARLASQSDSSKFINNTTFRLIDIIEAGKSWDLGMGGTVVYGNPRGTIRKLSYTSPVGQNVPNARRFILDFYRVGVSSRALAQIWVLTHTRIRYSGKSYYVVYFANWNGRNNTRDKWRLDNITDQYRQYLGSDTSLYLSTSNKRNIFDKIYLMTPRPRPITLQTTNVFFLFATTMGYQLHNMSKRVVIQYDL